MLSPKYKIKENNHHLIFQEVQQYECGKGTPTDNSKTKSSAKIWPKHREVYHSGLQPRIIPNARH